MRTLSQPELAGHMPSPGSVKFAFLRAQKAIGDSWKGWSLLQCLDVASAFNDQLRFRDLLLERATEKDRRFVSVSAAARTLKMHRASVHRYLQGKPHLRNSRGKVILGRLIDEIARGRGGLETRGRWSAMRPRRPRLNGLPDHLAPFRLTFLEFWAWRRELGPAWLSWPPSGCHHVAAELAPAAEFICRINERAIRLMPIAAA